jgi:hypothetical protein
MALRDHLKRLVSPAVRFQLRLCLSRWRRCLSVGAFWRWRTSTLSVANADPNTEGGVRLNWIGRDSERASIQAYFRLPLILSGAKPKGPDEWRGVLVSECWTPGAFKVPLFVEASIETGPAWAEVCAQLGGTVQKVLRRGRGKYSFRQVENETEILDLEQRMIRPFAERHGQETSHFDSHLLMRYAQGHAHGRFVAMEEAGKVVGCGFGFASFPGGVKTWNACRFGCLPEVFNDSKLLEVVNTQNVHCTTEWAQQAGYASVNLGVSFGPPDSGLIQWKCRRGAYPDGSAMSLFVYLRVPIALRALYFWQRPAFAMVGHQVELIAGVAPGVELADVLRRFKPLAFRRMVAFRVFCSVEFPTEHRQVVSTLLAQQGLDSPVIWIGCKV